MHRPAWPFAQPSERHPVGAAAAALGVQLNGLIQGETIRRVVRQLTPPREGEVAEPAMSTA